jgi:hypothetical protein
LKMDGLLTRFRSMLAEGNGSYESDERIGDLVAEEQLDRDYYAFNDALMADVEAFFVNWK